MLTSRWTDYASNEYILRKIERKRTLTLKIRDSPNYQKEVMKNLIITEGIEGKRDRRYQKVAQLKEYKKNFKVAESNDCPCPEGARHTEEEYLLVSQKNVSF